jgi:hypothetical protein
MRERTTRPDNHNRFMRSIAIGANGDIALGCSVSSSTMFPSIRYTTRKAGDPLGTLKPEQTLQTGSGSQTSSSGRWGDYTAMSVDPADECTFWYTNEYYRTTSEADWNTAVGRVPCTKGRRATDAGVHARGRAAQHRDADHQAETETRLGRSGRRTPARVEGGGERDPRHRGPRQPSRPRCRQAPASATQAPRAREISPPGRRGRRPGSPWVVLRSERETRVCLVSA